MYCVTSSMKSIVAPQRLFKFFWQIFQTPPFSFWHSCPAFSFSSPLLPLLRRPRPPPSEGAVGKLISIVIIAIFVVVFVIFLLSLSSVVVFVNFVAVVVIKMYVLLSSSPTSWDLIRIVLEDCVDVNYDNHNRYHRNYHHPHHHLGT